MEDVEIPPVCVKPLFTFARYPAGHAWRRRLWLWRGLSFELLASAFLSSATITWGPRRFSVLAVFGNVKCCLFGHTGVLVLTVLAIAARDRLDLRGTTVCGALKPCWRALYAVVGHIPPVGVGRTCIGLLLATSRRSAEDGSEIKRANNAWSLTARFVARRLQIQESSKIGSGHNTASRKRPGRQEPKH